jgi:hypothetical protein
MDVASGDDCNHRLGISGLVVGDSYRGSHDHFTRGGEAMKCRLCDRPTAAGSGKLCADCAKALQRARGAALRKLEPATIPAGAASAAAPITLTAAPPETPPTRSARPMVWLGIGVAAIVAVYIAQRELSAPGGAEPPAGRTPPTLTERGNVERSPVVTRVEEPSWTAVGEDTKPAVEPNVGQVPATATTPKAPVAASGAKTGTKVAKGASQDSKSMPPPLPAEYGGSAPSPSEAEAQAQLAGARVAAPAPPVDGAQVLASAMQKCGNEGFFSKFICEQKAFLQYCEDKWDKDPKCMRRTAER